MTKKAIQQMEQEFINNEFPILAWALHEYMSQGEIFEAVVSFDDFMNLYVKRLREKSSNDSLIKAASSKASGMLVSFVAEHFCDKCVDEFMNILLQVAEFSDEEVAELMVD